MRRSWLHFPKGSAAEDFPSCFAPAPVYVSSSSAAAVCSTERTATWHPTDHRAPSPSRPTWGAPSRLWTPGTTRSFRPSWRSWERPRWVRKSPGKAVGRPGGEGTPAEATAALLRLDSLWAKARPAQCLHSEIQTPCLNVQENYFYSVWKVAVKTVNVSPRVSTVLV